MCYDFITVSKTSSSSVFTLVWNETQQEYMPFPVLPHNDKRSDNSCVSAQKSVIVCADMLGRSDGDDMNPIEFSVVFGGVIIS